MLESTDLVERGEKVGKAAGQIKKVGKIAAILA